MTECCILLFGTVKTLDKTVGYWLKEFVVSGYRQKCPIYLNLFKRELCMRYAVVFTHFMAASLMLLLNPSLAIAVEIDFEREVLPILEDRCWHCHGEDEVESGLRLDRRATMLKGGDSGLAAVVPGQVADSYLVEVVKHLDPGMEMPPDDAQIPAEEIAVLEAWIEQGAIWPGQMKQVAQERVDLWSFQPVIRPDLPSRGTSTPAEVVRSSENVVDQFLLHGHGNSQ